MSPRYERLMFRVGVVGLALVMGLFVYWTVINPVKAGPAATTTTTTAPGETTTTTEVRQSSFTIVSPRDQATVSQPQILLAGVGTPGGVVARGTVVTAVDARGVWSMRLDLAEGVNKLDLIETLPDESTKTASITVVFQP